MSATIDREFRALAGLVNPLRDSPRGWEDSGDVDSARMLELARAHRVRPLLYKGLQRSRQANGEHLLDLLEPSVERTAARNLLFAATLEEVVTALSDADIPVLAFKGPVLASGAYDDLAAREFGDLDLLVAREDLTAAVDVLERLGFATTIPRRDDASVRGGLITMPLVAEYTLRRELPVEVRWRVGDVDRPFHLDFETLWSRGCEYTVAGAAIPGLAPVDRVQMLAFHGSKHRWHRLEWVCDFAATVDRLDVPATTLLERASAAGTTRRLLTAYALSNRLFDLWLPGVVRNRLVGDVRAARMASAVAEGLEAGAVGRPGYRSRVAHNVAACDSWRDQVRSIICARPLHPSLPEYRTLPLDGQVHVVYYPLRPLRILAERIPTSRIERKPTDARDGI